MNANHHFSILFLDAQGYCWEPLLFRLPSVPSPLPCIPALQFSFGKPLWSNHRLCVSNVLNSQLLGSAMRAPISPASVIRKLVGSKPWQRQPQRTCWREGKKDALPSVVAKVAKWKPGAAGGNRCLFLGKSQLKMKPTQSGIEPWDGGRFQRLPLEHLTQPIQTCLLSLDKGQAWPCGQDLPRAPLKKALLWLGACLRWGFTAFPVTGRVIPDSPMLWVPFGFNQEQPSLTSTPSNIIIPPRSLASFPKNPSPCTLSQSRDLAFRRVT